MRFKIRSIVSYLPRLILRQNCGISGTLTLSKDGSDLSETEEILFAFSGKLGPQVGSTQMKYLRHRRHHSTILISSKSPYIPIGIDT